MNRKGIIISAIISLFLFHCASGSGSIRKGQRYSPNSGLFSVPAPVGYGGRYDETAHSVAFYDDMLEFYRIDYGRLDPGKAAILDEKPIEQQLMAFGAIEFLEPLKENVPGTRLIHREFIDNGPEKLFLMVILIPEGSTYAINGSRQDVERGLLFFRRQDHMFILHTQYAPNIFSMGQEKSVSTDEKVAQVRNKLLSFRASLNINL
ncbi:MAG TPA: hypothetical protein DEA96_17220 [Leptospiraceae bacterium]|nr:hypothetical protein [Spirochaetaceae bacterium]HBS06713.1 hypothetical protein [Leptospiraceae bacterium]